MSRKKNRQRHKKRKQTQNFLWILLVLGGAFIALAVFLFANQRGGGGGGTPSIAVNQQQIDYGDVKFSVAKTFAVQVTNTGDGPLRFKEAPYIQVLEGC